MTENLTEQYKGYAVYLPSLQANYANYATKANSETTRAKKIPKNFDTRWLNFLDTDSELWHCGYTLYSCGQFDNKQIRTRDIIAERNRKNTIVIGDSGGFQLGTGAITNKAELAHLERYKNNPIEQFNRWHECGFRERTLRWLDRYTDYAMTLDMVLWAAEGNERPNSKKSQLRKLSVEQLIDLSVDNLRYFSDNRGQGKRRTKFLNVIQDTGNGTGEAWYRAVRDFEFEGFALGNEHDGMIGSIRWLKRLLDDYQLDKCEWIHSLAKSPPINSVAYTAAQRALRKLLRRNDLTISFDSSTPMQIAGKQKKLIIPNKLNKNIETWKIGGWPIPHDIRIARNEKRVHFPFASPLSKYMTVNDLMAHDIDDSDYFTDVWAEQMLVNHNIYTYHRYSIDACDLVFDDTKMNHERVPSKILEMADLIERYLEAENSSEIEEKLNDLMK